MTHWNTVYNPCLNNMPYSIFCWHHYTIAKVIYENHFIISLKEGRFGSHLTLIIITCKFQFYDIQETNESFSIYFSSIPSFAYHGCYEKSLHQIFHFLF